MRTNKRTIGMTAVAALAILFVGVGSATAQNDLSNGLIGYWPMDEGSGSTTADASGKGNTGTLIAGQGGGIAPQWNVGGRLGKCLSFDGLSSYVDCGNADILKPASVTVAAWVKFDTYPYYGQVAGFATDTGSEESGYSILVDSYYVVGSAANITMWISGGTPVDGTYIGTNDVPTAPVGWTHVAATYDGTTTKVYVNGIPKVSDTTESGPIDYTYMTKFYIGVYWTPISGQTNWWLPYLGLIDEVSVWDYPLSSGSIFWLASGKTPFSKFITSVTESGGSTDVSEDGATDSYQVVLNKEPNIFHGPGQVVISISKDASQVQTNKTSMTFTPANWSTPQTVVVSAVNDTLMEGDHTSTITHSAVSDDPTFNGAAVAPVVVNIEDNDVPGITVTESGGSTAVTEGGATDSFTVVLKTEPNQGVGSDGKVYITITVADVVDETTVNGGGAVTLTFTTANWNTAKTVTVVAVNDTQVEGNHVSQITFDITSQDVGYDPGWPGFPVPNPATIWVAVTDNDGTAQQEAARWEFDTTNVNLSARTVNDSVGDFDATMDYDSGYKVPTLFEKAGTGYHYLETNGPDDPNWIIEVFEMSNKWHYLPQQAITLEAWVAPDDAAAYYEGIINCHQDTGAFERGWWLGNNGDQFGFGLSTASSLGYIWSTTHYASGQWHHVAATYNGTTVRLYVDGLEENSSTTRSGPINYSDAAFVLSAYLDDDEKYTFEGRLQEVRMYNYARNAAAIMSDYVAMPPGSLTTITESGGSTAVSETGPTSDSYTVVLKALPSASVLITVEPTADLNVGTGAGNPKTLTFTTGNWNTAQTVTVTAVDDEELEGDEVITIKHTISSGDADYNRSGVRNVYVNVEDNDCGAWGYSPMDFNLDCYVDLKDFAEFASHWLECTEPDNPNCVNLD